mgnify:CR=1 FL=1
MFVFPQIIQIFTGDCFDNFRFWLKPNEFFIYLINGLKPVPIEYKEHQNWYPKTISQTPTFTLQIFPETPEFSFFEIIQVLFISIGFSFKWDSFVGQITVFELEKPVIIFNDVENIEENDKHFQLLPQMDFFVIDQYIIFLIFGFPNEDKGK